ncbi:MAG TPA: phage major capsid protein [Euzebyales bacterium]
MGARMDEIDARLGQIDAELEVLAGRSDPLTADDERRFRELEQEFGRLRTLRGELERVERAVAGGSTIPGSSLGSGPSDARSFGGDPWQRRSGALASSPADLRGRAVAAVERTAGVPVDGQQRLADAFDHHEPGTSEGDLLSRWAVASSDPAYRTAFAALVRDPMNGHRSWSADELDAYRRAETVSRQLEIGTDAGGGFMVPFQLDPTIMLTSAGSVDPLRRISRVVTAVSDVWHGVSSAGVTAEWLAEHAEAADATPTMAQPTVNIFKGSAFVPFSVEWEGDAVNGMNELAKLLLDAADQLMAAAHVNGTGSGQPEGVASGLAAGSKVPAGTADTIAVADVTGLQNALGARFQPNAQWLANLTVINTINSFETAGGSLRFPEVANDRLLRRPLNEASHLDTPGDTASAGNDNVLLYGDFQAGYVVADRVGTRIELIPHLVGANRRPTGQRGAWLWFRTGAGVVVDEAFRILTA